MYKGTLSLKPMYFKERCAVENTPVEFNSLHFSKHPPYSPNTAVWEHWLKLGKLLPERIGDPIRFTTVLSPLSLSRLRLKRQDSCPNHCSGNYGIFLFTTPRILLFDKYFPLRLESKIFPDSGSIIRTESREWAYTIKHLLFIILNLDLLRKARRHAFA